MGAFAKSWRSRKQAARSERRGKPKRCGALEASPACHILRHETHSAMRGNAVG